LPRTARSLYPDTDYFIMSRSGEGMLLFRDDSDFATWLKILPFVQTRFPEIELLAFCLLPDAMCLVVHDSGQVLGDFMRLLQGRYSRARRDVYGSGSRLYGGERFSSIPLPGQGAIGSVLSWVHRLPAEQGLVLFPEMWKWSSFRAYAAGEDWPVLNGSGRVASILGPDVGKGFRKLVDSSSGEPDWSALRKAGDRQVPKQGSAPRMLPADPAGLVARDLGVRRGDLLKPKGLELRRLRHRAFEECRSRWGMSFAEIARAFGVTPGAVIQALAPEAPAAQPAARKPRQKAPRRAAKKEEADLLDL
jgi:putative transposase